MSDPPSALADLLTDCDGHDIRLALAADGNLEIDAPPDTLSPELLSRLKAYKADLLAMLGPAPEVDPAPLVATEIEVAAPKIPICRCGSTTWRDVPIHGGQSVRRDCGGCGRFVDFPNWYEEDTGLLGQYSVGCPDGKEATQTADRPAATSNRRLRHDAICNC